MSYGSDLCACGMPKSPQVRRCIECVSRSRSRANRASWLELTPEERSKRARDAAAKRGLVVTRGT